MALFMFLVLLFSYFDYLNCFCFIFPLVLTAPWQPWRASSMCPFGGLDQFPSIEALFKNGKDRTLQAIELESGIGHQWRLWKWASYCASEVLYGEIVLTKL